MISSFTCCFLIHSAPTPSLSNASSTTDQPCCLPFLVAVTLTIHLPVLAQYGTVWHTHGSLPPGWMKALRWGTVQGISYEIFLDSGDIGSGAD